MAKLALVYGMRLLPEEDLGEVKDATVVLQNGRITESGNHEELMRRDGLYAELFAMQARVNT